MTLTTPANGATFNAPAAVNFSASVTANGQTINSVWNYNGAILLGSATVAPYNFAWTNVPPAAYTESAEVVYNPSQTASSAPAFITVQGVSSVPSSTTLAATAVGTNAATLNGSVNPNRLATTGYFQ